VSAIAGPKLVKYRECLQQGSEAEAPALTEQTIMDGYARYRSIFGVWPPRDENITDDQLACLHHAITSGALPWADFTVFGPHGHRIMVKLRMSGLVMQTDGTFATQEFRGPPTFEMWDQCYQILRTGLIFLGEVELGPMEMYRERIKRYITKWGPGLWHLVYQADVRMRREEMELIRRVGAEAKAANPAHPFDPKRPWNWVWQQASKDVEFWKDQLEDGAIQILTHTKSLGAFLDGDAPVVGAARGTKRTADIHHVSDAQDVGNGRPAREPKEPKKAPKNPDRNVDNSVIKDGKYQCNKRGTSICYGYNDGSCKGTGAQPCLKVSSRTHQCHICLGAHSATDCPKGSSSSASKQERKRGAGKGKGRGKR
jgi:hypothetical protein